MRREPSDLLVQRRQAFFVVGLEGNRTILLREETGQSLKRDGSPHDELS